MQGPWGEIPGGFANTIYGALEMNVSKRAKAKMNSVHASKKVKPKRIEKISNPQIEKIGTHELSDGNKVSIFDVCDYRALTQLIGYAKFLNADYGNVYYRGEARLHHSMLPSISRQKKQGTQDKMTSILNGVINNAINDVNFSKFAGLNNLKNKGNKKLIVEALLQHYGYSTHFIDVVDNHWIALWFGLNQIQKIIKRAEYYLYTRRTVNPIDIYTSGNLDNSIYQYMLLIAVDNKIDPIERGIYVGHNMITIDLRSSLPSVFLRPHAQHGLVIQRNRHQTQEAFDIDRNIVAIIRLRIDKVASWIGEGRLLTNSNLFPSPAYDYGYEILLERNDLFKNAYHKIAQYI